MNYEEMTDFELNSKLAVLLGMRVATVDDAPFNYHINQKTPEQRLFEYHKNYPNTVWCLKDGEPWEQYCFTLDWNTTMPIAVKYGLSIELPDVRLGGVGTITYFIENSTDVSIDFKSKDNPLRAIVICLIKILEAENANRKLL